MGLIVVHHLVVHGTSFLGAPDGLSRFGTWQKLLVEPFTLAAVDCFVFISGYFSIRLRFTKAAGLWLQCLSYSVTIAAAYGALFPGALSPWDHVRACFPITSFQWWFMSVYFALMLLAPALNALAAAMAKPLFGYVLAAGAFVNCGVSFVSQSTMLSGSGYSLVNFMYVYLLARYLRLHGGERIAPARVLLLVYAGSSLAVAAASIVLYESGASGSIWQLYSYDNPLVIASAAALFYLFKDLRFSSRLVNGLGGLVFGAYLLHDNPYVRSVLYARVFRIADYSATAAFPLVLAAYALAILAAGLAVEKLRVLLMSPMVAALGRSRLAARADAWLDSLP